MKLAIVQMVLGVAISVMRESLSSATRYGFHHIWFADVWLRGGPIVEGSEE